MRLVVYAQDVGATDVALVGGKGANLGEMVQMGLPVPEAFIVTSDAFRLLLRNGGLAPKLEETLKGLDAENSSALEAAAKRAQQIVAGAAVPKEVETAIRDAIKGWNGQVAVRSSATAEDLPEASFAGQQDTYLHVPPETVVAHVQKCWASLFTPRAIYYRARQGFPHEKVQMAVVVQRMVNAECSGVMFTRHPTTGERRVIIEAAFGLGEGVVGGHVTPDHYEMDPQGHVLVRNVSHKEKMIALAPSGTGTRVAAVPERQRDKPSVSEDQLKQLVRLAQTLEKHYGGPQDVEWAFEKGELSVLQTRPVTTIKKKAPEAAAGTVSGEVLVKGLPASPGVGTGRVIRLFEGDPLDRVKQGDVLITPMTVPDMVPAMRRVVAIVTDEGGVTAHAAIVSRELGIPCVVGTKRATTALSDGQFVAVDGDRGTVTAASQAEARAATESPVPVTQPSPGAAQASEIITATGVKVNISMPEATQRALAVQPDGVGLLRIEHIVLALGEHPMKLIQEGRREAYVKFLMDAIRTVAKPMHPRPVWVRTLDAPTDEFRRMPGGEGEPKEHNPMLGFRGIRRSLEQTDLFKAELEAIKRLRDEGLIGIGVMLPLVQHPREIRRAKEIARGIGLDPDDPKIQFGIMIEIPAAALIIDDLLDERLDFVSFGTNDLTQYTLAVDRNNEHVGDLFDEFHPAVTRLIREVILACRKRGVETSICGQAGSNPKFVEKLVEWGISSVSANIDALVAVRRAVARAERRLLLEKARGG